MPGSFSIGAVLALEQVHERTTARALARGPRR